MAKHSNATAPNPPSRRNPALESQQADAANVLSDGIIGNNVMLGVALAQQQPKDVGLDVRDVIRAIFATLDEYLPEVPSKQHEIIRENIEIALVEASSFRSLRKELEPSLLSRLNLAAPVRELSSDEFEEIMEIGRAHPWSNRKEGNRKTPLRWLQDHYGRFIPGLLRNHIRQIDRGFYASLMKEIGRKGLPEGMDFPTRDENEKRRLAEMFLSQSDNDAVRRDAMRREKLTANVRAFQARRENLHQR
jgi:hypothetical protein